MDEAALVEALRNGEIFAAGLDVYEDEPELAPGLAELDNVVVAPTLPVPVWRPAPKWPPWPQKT